jgi:hypothetical protein
VTTTPSSIPSRIPEAPAAPLWLKMLRAAGLGLRPERVLIAMVAMVIITGLIRVPLPWEASQSLLSLWQSAVGRAGLWSWSEPSRAFSQFATFASDHPWAMLAVGTPAAFVIMAAMATIARMAAVELATGELVPAKRAFRLVSARFGSLAAVLLVPAGLVAVVLFAFAGVGGLLLSVSGLNIVGALLYGVAVILSIGLVIVGGAFVLATPMLAPAVVCEGTGSGENGRGDAIDALQRPIAYVLAAPLRLALFAAIGLAQVLAVGWIGNWVASTAVTLARGACTHWLSAETVQSLASDGDSATMAARVMGLWESVPELLAAACTLSVFTAASTVLYLLLRRVCDGQHEREIWLPTASPGLAASEHPADRPEPASDE